MEVNRLLTDELSYELAVRSISEPNTVAEKRAALRGVLRCERDGQTFPCIAKDLNPEHELLICKTKLADLTRDIDNFNLDNKMNEYNRIHSRLLHISGRLNRIKPIDELSDTEKRTLLLKTMQLIDEVSNLVVNLSQSQTSVIDNINPAITNNPLDEPNLLLPEIAPPPTHRVTFANHPWSSTRRYDGTPRSSHCSEDGDMQINATFGPSLSVMHTAGQALASPSGKINEEIRRLSQRLEELKIQTTMPTTMSFQHPTTSTKFPTVHKWNLNYDGNSSVNCFLERVDEFCH